MFLQLVLKEVDLPHVKYNFQKLEIHVLLDTYTNISLIKLATIQIIVSLVYCISQYNPYIKYPNYPSLNLQIICIYNSLM